MMPDLSCPYCGGVDFAAGFERRPMQHVERCNNCLKYSVRSPRSKTRYPMSNPLDSASLPHTRKPI